ncbi:MAG: DUF2845 domain-containing protein [Halopseudomonas sp.]|uniref:DUF2845 domain-containing protein n=1 Tax=Halopseudomonas sp. TaxID=2901191 RepID=UPI0030021155
MNFRAPMLLATALCLCATQAAASLRCDHGLVSEGDNKLEVEMKCGEPVNASVTRPATDEYGNPVQGSATVEHWMYGPQNGMYRYLRFIDGTLVEIDSKRN